MSLNNSINGIGGISSDQDTSLPRFGRVSDADIMQFEQEMETVLQDLQTTRGFGGSPGDNVSDSGSGNGTAIDAAISPGSTVGRTGTQVPDTNQLLEQVAEALLHALARRNETDDPGNVGRGSSDSLQSLTATSPSSVSSSASAETQTPGNQTQPVSTGKDGGTASVDGAKPNGDSIAMQVVNNTGKNERVVLTNSQNRIFAEADLRPGERQTFLLDPNDPNTRSARMQTTAPDGSLRQDAKLTEFNLQPGHTAINVSNNNFAGITGTDGHTVDSEQMKIDDNQGKVVGDGAANGAYRNSVDDANAMIMGDDTSKNYTVTIS